MEQTDYKKLLNSAKFQVIKKTLDVISGNGFIPHLYILIKYYFSHILMV
ncbi:hypothetical protein wGmm_0638 [Wolbachia endosymbiont of Glossina morsitans morsitans]|nr:hypothetical protein wGmm_0638 [Wolbachia endosymbiont of Glossina morsitans morsitans]